MLFENMLVQSRLGSAPILEDVRKYRYVAISNFMNYNFSSDRGIYPFVHPIVFFSPIDMPSEICQSYATLSSLVRCRLSLWQLLAFFSALRA